MIQFDRLLKLADFLDTVPPERFCFGEWVTKNWQDGKTLEQSCGTSACAMGWATMVPEFRDLGLRIARSRFEQPFVTFGDPSCLDDAYDASLQAAVDLFGLSYEDACRLFLPASDVGRLEEEATAAEVADHIRSFVAEQRTPQAPTGEGR